MPDQPAPQNPNPDPTPNPAAPSDPDGLGDAGKRAIQVERDARQAAEGQVRSLTEQLTAATDRATAFEAANTNLTGQVEAGQLQITRLNVALDKGLPKAFVDRLQGTDEATFAADADALLALVPRPTTPRPDPSQGPRNPAPTDPAAAWAAALQQARRH